MIKASFFNIETLIEVDSKVWIVDKLKPNIPLLKISLSDFNLIKSGIYRSQNNRVDYNGNTYWLSNNITNQLKVKMKLQGSGFTNIGISMQEFLNPDLVENINHKINMDNILHLKNLNDDIYIICSRKSKTSYESLILKLEEELKENGLKIKKYYYISDTFYQENKDDIEYKTIKLLIQHSLGYKTDNGKFSDVEIDRYDMIDYYDNNNDTISLSREINPILKSLLKKTSDGISDVIKEDIKEYKPCITINYITDNEANKKISKKIDLDYSNLIKTFESFKRV